MKTFSRLSHKALCCSWRPMIVCGGRPFRTLPRQNQCRHAHICANAAVEQSQTTEEKEIEPLVIEKIDLRVGRIISAEPLPEAEDLYIEKVDVGEEEPRTILSGLKKYVPVEDLQDRMVVVVANLPVRKMLGQASQGMLLCASNSDHTVVEPLLPPSEAPPGERIFWGPEGRGQSEAATPNQVKKKKFWEKAQPLLKTDANKTPTFEGLQMLTSSGPVTSTLENARIS